MQVLQLVLDGSYELILVVKVPAQIVVNMRFVSIGLESTMNLVGYEFYSLNAFLTMHLNISEVLRKIFFAAQIIRWFKEVLSVVLAFYRNI